MKNKTFTNKFYKEINGKEICIIVSFEYVNVGIGPYEFWGQKCNDNRMSLEFIGAKIGNEDYAATDDEISSWLENAEFPED